MKPKIRIIFDNGGGATLQIVHNELRYQHIYHNMETAAADAATAMREDLDLSDWEGNEAEEHGWLDPSRDDLTNGGYRVLSVKDLLDCDEEDPWHNVVAMQEHLVRAID